MGLGNPGERYRETRHNAGFWVVEELARRRGVRLGAEVPEECHSRVGQDGDLWLALPQTYMNRSGYAVHCLIERHGFQPADILVVYDDVNLPLGRLRLRRSGSPGGHRGLESIVEALRTDQVPRLRLGIAGEGGPPPGGDALVDFVLGAFPADERPAVDEMVGRAAEACAAWLEKGIEAAMGAFNH